MMTQLFQYTLAVSVPMFILWIVYRAGLASEKQFVANRCALLGIYVISLVLFPCLTLFDLSNTDVVPSVVIRDSSNEIVTPAFWLPKLSAMARIWTMGMGVVLLLTITQLVRIYMVVRGCRRMEVDGQTIYVTSSKSLAPFSIGKIIVINSDDYEECGSPIITHELGHIVHGHSLDMLVAQLFAVIFWYNPAAWLLRAELKSVHEYQADAYAVSNGLDLRDYQMLLLKKAVGSKFPTLANNLNHSKLRQRISMMNRPGEISLWNRLRYLLLVVGVTASGLTLYSPVVKAAVSPAGVMQKLRVIDLDEVIVVGYSRSSDTEKSTVPRRESLEEQGIEVYIDGMKSPSGSLNEIDPSAIESITIGKGRKRIDVVTEASHTEGKQ